MLKINIEQKIIDINIPGDLELEKNLVLGIHMIRSEKHFNIFKIIEEIKIDNVEELKDKFDFDLVDRYDETRVVVYGFGTHLDLFITNSYIRRNNMFFIPVRIGSKINYIKVVLDNDLLKNASLMTLKIPASFKVCGRIDKSVTAMIQSSKDHGKISFKKIK